MSSRTRASIVIGAPEGNILVDTGPDMRAQLLANGIARIDGPLGGDQVDIGGGGADDGGKDADAALGRAHMTVNKNAVPNDPRPPMVTSGLRIGTPAVTTRGFKETEARQLSHWIAQVLDALGDESVVERVRGEVMSLCRRFPVYA